MDKSFTYQLGTNYPEQTANPEVKADFDNINKTIVSMQIGQVMTFHFQQTTIKHSLYCISFRFFPTLFWSKSSFNRNMEYHYCKSRRCAQVWTRKKTSTGY
jgi:hypothetical protein